MKWLYRLELLSATALVVYVATGHDMGQQLRDLILALLAGACIGDEWRRNERKGERSGGGSASEAVGDPGAAGNDQGS